VACEVLCFVLAFPIGIVLRFADDFCPMFTRVLAVAVNIFNSHQRESPIYVASRWIRTRLHDNDRAVADVHLDTVIADHEANRKAEGIAQPFCGFGYVRIRNLWNDSAGRNRAIL